MKGFRWFVNISGIIKWGSALFLIVCTIILVVTNKGLAFSEAAEGTKNINLILPKINNAFSGFFYFFIGFETFIVVGKNVKNPTKNFGKGILIVLLLSTIFYLAVSVLVFGAITIDGTNGQNGWSGATNEYNPNNVISGIAGITGMIVLVISTLSLKLNGAMQNSLYSGGMIQPLAKEGYITEKLAKLNKENIAMRASTANLIITIIGCIIMLIIPDLIGAHTNEILNIFPDTGKNHDFKTFKNSKLEFLSETVILADKGYQGLQKIDSNTFLPIKTSKNNPKTSKIKIFNKIINKTRRKIEHVFAFLKCFKIIGYKFRKGRKRIFLRFNLIAGFYNLSLKLKNVMQ
ncbi:amino acid permease [Spiroplasma endosymbiont of Melieria omissa]|uniref:amino acid permease n=1 Tax=Spiroplasma endosymbiont of Melieria omissa TaxID=3139324 RepID=UPI003CCB710E